MSGVLDNIDMKTSSSMGGKKYYYTHKSTSNIYILIQS